MMPISSLMPPLKKSAKSYNILLRPTISLLKMVIFWPTIVFKELALKSFPACLLFTFNTVLLTPLSLLSLMKNIRLLVSFLPTKALMSGLVTQEVTIYLWAISLSTGKLMPLIGISLGKKWASTIFLLPSNTLLASLVPKLLTILVILKVLLLCLHL